MRYRRYATKTAGGSVVFLLSKASVKRVQWCDKHLRLNKVFFSAVQAIVIVILRRKDQAVRGTLGLSWNRRLSSATTIALAVLRRR